MFVVLCVFDFCMCTAFVKKKKRGKGRVGLVALFVGLIEVVISKIYINPY